MADCSRAKTSVHETFTGISVPPRWRIVPASSSSTSPSKAPDHERTSIIINPGPGFGDGTHETTQLCLQAISAFAPRPQRLWRMLDFGSGSGILSIAAAKLGAAVEAVEISEPAIENARDNAERNSVDDKVQWSPSLDAIPGPFELVVANILRGVLLEFADQLVARVATEGRLVLSGLVSTDVPEVSVRYAFLLMSRPEIYQRGEWRALCWHKARALGK